MSTLQLRLVLFLPKVVINISTNKISRVNAVTGFILIILLSLPAPSGAQDIIIGVIVGRTGHGASYGEGIVAGAEMAVNEINTEGGINGSKVVLEVVDDTSDPARSAIAMRRLISVSPDLIVGGWGSPQVLAHMDFPEQSAVPYIVVGATSHHITRQGYKWVFRVIQTDSVVTRQLAEIVTNDYGKKRIAIINDNNAYGSNSRDIFNAAISKFGNKVIIQQSYNSFDTIFAEQLQRVKNAQPDAIVIFGTIPAVPAIMNQARELGIEAQFFGGAGLSNEELIKNAPVASEGTVLMSYFNEESDVEAHAWAERYRQAYGKRLYSSPVQAAWEYRAIKYIAAPCLRSAGSDRIALRNCIADWHGNIFGVSVEAYFDSTGQLVQPVLSEEVRERGFHLLKGAQ